MDAEKNQNKKTVEIAAQKLAEVLVLVIENIHKNNLLYITSKKHGKRKNNRR